MLSIVGDERLRRIERLRGERVFADIARRGRKLHTKHFFVVTAKNKEGFARLGAVASRKVGKAVARNRVKRVIR